MPQLLPYGIGFFWPVCCVNHFRAESEPRERERERNQNQACSMTSIKPDRLVSCNIARGRARERAHERALSPCTPHACVIEALPWRTSTTPILDTTQVHVRQLQLRGKRHKAPLACRSSSAKQHPERRHALRCGWPRRVCGSFEGYNAAPVYNNYNNGRLTRCRTRRPAPAWLGTETTRTRRS